MEGPELRDSYGGRGRSRALIRVPERGHVDIGAQEWRALSGDPGFWQLVDKKMLEVRHRTRGRVRLLGTRWVGSALLGGMHVELAEKVPGALASLLEFATEGAFRLARTPSSATELGNMARLLARQFLDATRIYASEGLEFHYASRDNIGSLGGGRINIGKTLDLRAQGLRHLIAFEQDYVTYDTPKNRVVLRALREIETIARLIGLPARDVARARSLALLFGDARATEVLFGAREAFARQAEQLTAEPEHVKDRDLLALASVMLSHESFEPRRPTARKAPRAWFLNLEDLFEKATRRTLARLCPAGMAVSKGRDRKPPIKVFTLVEDMYRANPDLVIESAASMVAVGDVKYKLWTGTAGHDDIYQLLVHAAAFRAPAAFLIFPGEGFSAQDLGVSATGCRTWVFTVDPRSLALGASEALLAMGLPTRGPRRVSAGASLRTRQAGGPSSIQRSGAAP